MRSVFLRAATIWISSEHKLQPQRFTSRGKWEAKSVLQAEPLCIPEAQFCLQEDTEKRGSRGRVWGPGAVWIAHTELCSAHSGIAELCWEEALWPHRHKAHLIFLGDWISPFSTVCRTQEIGFCSLRQDTDLVSVSMPVSKLLSFPDHHCPFNRHNHNFHKKQQTLVQSREKTIT